MGKPKKTSSKKAPKDLAVKDGQTVKGGSVISEVMKNFGGALNTSARGG